MRKLYLLLALMFLSACTSEKLVPYRNVLHNQIDETFYQMPDFSIDDFMERIDIIEEEEGYSCFCGADYLIYTYKDGHFDKAIVVYGGYETRLQFITHERTNDSLISEKSRELLDRHISQARQPSNQIESFTIPEADVFE